MQSYKRIMFSFCFINIIFNNNYFEHILINFNGTIDYFIIFKLHINFKLNIYLFNIYIKKRIILYIFKRNNIN